MKMSRNSLGFCVGLLILTGCGSLYERRLNQGHYDYWMIGDSHMGPYDRYYIGTKSDIFPITSAGQPPLGVALCSIDLPFTFALDTLLLPLDFTLTQLDKKERQPTLEPVQAENPQ